MDFDSPLKLSNKGFVHYRSYLSLQAVEATLADDKLAITCPCISKMNKASIRGNWPGVSLFLTYKAHRGGLRRQLESKP